MAFKNPNNVITLDDDISEYIAAHGIYYSDTRARYPDMANVVVRCDRCGTCPLACCIGVDDYGSRSYDLCMSCVELARTNKLSVRELEESVGITDKSNYSMEELEARLQDIRDEQVEDGKLTDIGLECQYMFSDIQRALLESLYECLAEHKAEHFRLNKAESEDLMAMLVYILKVHQGRIWPADPNDRVIHPDFMRQPPEPMSGSGTPPENSRPDSPDS
jgi:hypothetical protein